MQVRSWCAGSTPAASLSRGRPSAPPLTKLRDDRGQPDPNDYVFTDPAGQPLSQEWLHKCVWLVTLERAGLRCCGQYNIRDSFITIALSAGEDPGWVAKVCGTSEEMIFRHYRTWIPGLTPDAGAKVGRILSGVGGGHPPPSASPVASPTPKSTVEIQRKRLLDRVEAGRIEPRTTGTSSEPRTKRTRPYLLRPSRERPPNPVIWAPGAHN
jgi:hypothetical protein